MSAMGQKRTSRMLIRNVCFTPKSRHAQGRHRCLLSAISRRWRPKNDLKPRGAVCGLPCLHAQNEWVQSPSHRETGEKNVGVILVGNDLSDERIPDVLIAWNQPNCRGDGEVVEDLHALLI